MAVCQNLVPLVNIKIAGKWMFIPLKMVLIGIDPYPYTNVIRTLTPESWSKALDWRENCHFRMRSFMVCQELWTWVYPKKNSVPQILFSNYINYTYMLISNFEANHGQTENQPSSHTAFRRSGTCTAFPRCNNGWLIPLHIKGYVMGYIYDVYIHICIYTFNGKYNIQSIDIPLLDTFAGWDSRTLCALASWWVERWRVG